MSDEGERKKQDISDKSKKIEDLKTQNASYDSIIKKKLAEIDLKEEEVKHMDEQIASKKEQIGTLKKQIELRDNKTRNVIQNRRKFSETLIEGNLLMAKGNDKRLSRMYFWLERSHKGTPVLLWAPNQMSVKVERAVVKGIESENQAFKVNLGFGKHFKPGSIQVHEQDPEIFKSWVSKFETALTTWNEAQNATETGTVKKKSITVKEFTFESSPLGFGIDARDEKSDELIVTTIKNKDLLDNELKVGMIITTCNGRSLVNLKYGEGATIIKAAVGNISAKNPVTLRFEGSSEVPEVTSEDKNIEDLYPDAKTSMSVREHPMLKNPELSKYRDDEKFQALCQELISDQKKLNEFLRRKDLEAVNCLAI